MKKENEIVPEEKKALTPTQRFGALLNVTYKKQITNFLGDDKTASRFISSIIADVQRNPKLLECTTESLINSYMTMAQLGFMPSFVSGEAYVLPYKKNYQEGGEWKSTMQAQLQIGYQGFVTLLYNAGVDSITSEIVRKNDVFTYVNGQMTHDIDPFKSKEERGEAIGVYVIFIYNGKGITKFMNGKDVIAHAKKYSKSYDPKGKFSPWNPENDDQLWMWKKTCLIQGQKLLPKSDLLNRAIDIDNRDSRISDAKIMVENSNLKMGNFLRNNENSEEGNVIQIEEPAQDAGTDSSQA